MKKYVLTALAVMASFVASSSLSANTVDLTGTWSGRCAATGQQDSTMRLNFTFSDAADNKGNAITNLHVFQGADCQALVKNTNFVASYSVGEEFGEGIAFDMTVTTALETSYNEEMTQLLNMSGHCGYSDWITGITKIVDIAKCNAKLLFGANQTLYTIIKVVDDNGTAQLLFGDRSGDNNGSTPDKRPDTIDAQRKYAKQ